MYLDEIYFNLESFYAHPFGFYPQNSNLAMQSTALKASEGSSYGGVTCNPTSNKVSYCHLTDNKTIIGIGESHY